MISPKQPVRINDIDYVCERVLANNDVILTHVLTGAPKTLSQNQFHKLYDEGALTFLKPEQAEKPGFNPDLAHFPSVAKTEQDHAERMLGYLLYSEQNCPKPSKHLLKLAIAEWAEKSKDENPPSVATIYRMRKRWRRAGRDIRALIRGTYKRGARLKRLSHEVYKLIFDSIYHVYLSRHRFSIKALHAYVCNEIIKLNATRRSFEQLDLPSQATVRRAVHQVDPYERDFARYGKKHAEGRFKIYGRGPMPEQILERVEIDHTLLDIIVVCEKTRVPLGRPTFTVAVDKFSKMPLGFYLGFEVPSSLSVNSCLRDAIRTKSYIKEDYPDIKHDCFVYGIPLNLITDNGMEFHASILQKVCHSLGIFLDPMPVASPEWKATVERFIGTLQRALIHTLPGSTFANPTERGEEDSVKAARHTIPELRGLIWRWILDVYAHEMHRALDNSPANVWAESALKHGINLPNRIEDLDPLLAGIEFRSISNKTGVTLFGLKYGGPNLEGFIHRVNGPDRYEIRFDPGNLFTIKVVDPENDTLVELESMAPEYTMGLSLHTHRAVRKAAKRAYLDSTDMEALYAAKAELMDKAMEKAAEKARKNQLFGKSSARLVGNAVRQKETNAEASAPLPVTSSIQVQPADVPSSSELPPETPVSTPVIDTAILQQKIAEAARAFIKKVSYNG
jgi:putative transposase